MTKGRCFGVIAFGSLVLAACDGPSAPGDLGVPACTTVAGTGAVTFTTDAGATLTPTSEVLTTVTYTRGLAALSGSRLMMASSGTVFVSEDAGCSWDQIATLPNTFTPMRAASATAAYAWPLGDAITNVLHRISIDGNVATRTLPVEAVHGMWTSAGRVRIAGERGQILESTDEGIAWTPIGSPAVEANAIGYEVAFDPADGNHAVFGVANLGAFVTLDGGQHWARANIGTTASVKNHNFFSLAISAVDGHTVWAAGLDIAEADAGVGNGRHIYLSRDGGQSFQAVVSERPGEGVPPRNGITIVNGPTLATHPTDADIMYFVFGSSFQNYGTDIIEYDASTSLVTVRHNAYHDISAIVFAPNRPRTMYLGLVWEPGGGLRTR